MIRRLLFALLIFVPSAAVFAQPTARTGARLVYHQELQSMILFGGLTRADSSSTRYPLGDTWEFNGTRWIRLLPPDSPSPRADFVMVYDSARERMVLFGGMTSVLAPNTPIVVSDETWVFDDSNWTRVDTPNTPPARRLAGAAYDPVRDRVVLFGGGTGTASLFDTWEFDGTTWNLIQASGPEVTNHSVVYDKARNEILMMGIGTDAKPVIYRYNGSGWDKLSPATMPACVAQGVMVYHERSGRVIHYGGLCADTGIPSSETWQWDGTTWGKVLASPTAGAVFAAAGDYDPVREQIVIFGGDSFGPRSLTFRFLPDDRWVVVTSSGAPGPRSLMVWESDPVRNVIWLFGGQNESSRFTDLWSYGQGRWHRVSLTTDAPTACDYPLGAFDKDRARLVIFCESADVFEFDGARWTKFASLTTEPPARRFASMVYDERNKRVVLFGGFNGLEYLDDTWLWNGTAWTEAKDGEQPPGRSLGMLFWDPVQDRVRLYGGIGAPNTEDAIVRYKDQWTFDGTRWTEAATTLTTPPARYGAYVEYDPLRERVVMFGGKNEREQYINEHWEWDGSAWHQIDSTGRPSPRMNGMLAFDPQRQAFTLFGGYAAAYFDEVWTLKDNHWQLQPNVLPERRRPVGKN